MIKLFLFAMLAIGLTSVAQVRDGSPMQDKMEKLTPEQKTERHLKKLTSELNLNSKQTAQVVGVAQSTIEKWRKEGIGIDHIIVGGRVMYPIRAIAKWQVLNQIKTA